MQIPRAEYLGNKFHPNLARNSCPKCKIFSFRRGVVYRGIYLPSLSGKLQDENLEQAYQKYAHRQRQKSLMLVNSADIALKILVLLKVVCYIDDDASVPDAGQTGTGNSSDSNQLMVQRTCYLVEPAKFSSLLAWLITAAVFNIVLAMVSWWRCYANNFLHWGAMATWILLLVQGKTPKTVLMSHNPQKTLIS